MFATSLDTHDACFILEAYHQKGSGYMENWEQVQKKLDEQRTSLEKKFNQLDLDIDIMIMDVESSNNQITIMSSEKATTQQPLKYVERDNLLRGPGGCVWQRVRSEDKGSCSEWQTRE